MPCRTCGGRITREQAQSGICPHCGAGLTRSGTGQPSSLPPRTGEVRNRRPQASAKSGGQTKWIIGGAIAICVTLLGVAGFAIARVFVADSEAIDTAQVEIVKPPALPTEVESAIVTPAAAESTTAVQPAPPVPQPPSTPDSNIAELLRKQQIFQREDIIKRVDEALKLVQKAGYGHVVVGQIKMDGAASPRDVIAQMDILEDGYFVDAVATAGAPIYFWHPGYDRLDVIPQGQKGAVENLGMVTMKPSTKPGGVVKGIMVANGSDVPKDLKPTITYSIPLINRCGADYQTRYRLAQGLLGRLKTQEAEKVAITPDTGEFVISHLPDIRFDLMFNTSERDSWLLTMDVSPGEEVDLSLCEMLRQSDTQAAAPALENADLAPDGKPEVDKLLAKLKAEPLILQYFQKRMDKDLRNVTEYRAKHGERSAVVIVGRIEVPARELNGSQVEAQMQIAKDGYFCAAVKPGRPVGFRLHGFEPLDYVPKGSHDGVEYCGVLRMTKTLDRETATVRGSVVVEGGRAPADLRVGVSENVDNINWWNGTGGTEGSAGNPQQSPAAITGNNFQVSQLSPISYSIEIGGSGFVDQYRNIRFKHNDRRTMPPFVLFRTRNTQISFIHSMDGTFHEHEVQQTIIDSDHARWQSAADLSVYKGYGHDFFFTQHGNTLSASFGYAVCEICDLGIRPLGDYRLINVVPGHDQWFGYPMHTRHCTLREGHVYLLKQGHWKHWILFRADAIKLAPMTGK